MVSSEPEGVPVREVRGPGPHTAPLPAQVVAADSTVRVLLGAASRALRGADCADLDHPPVLSSRLRTVPEPLRRAALTRAVTRTALPAGQAGHLDADGVARWMTGHYPGSYPALVVGSPHGAAVHLAAALGAPWLPAGFEVAVHWPGGAADDPSGALSYGAEVAAPVLAANPGATIRQVHDPAGRGRAAGAAVAFMLRWQRLPDAYREFLATRLAPGAPVLLVRDARTWPVLDPGGGHSFQLGGPATGLEPADFLPGSDHLRQLLRSVGGDPARWNPPAGPGPRGYAEHAVEPGFEAGLRDWARSAGHPLHRVLFPCPEALSAAVADLYRSWLRVEGGRADGCVVECGRLLDPWQVLRAGLVPYWCESASARSAEGAEWWLAGSSPFACVDVLPEPPGGQPPGLAGLPQWLAVASFGRLRGTVDRVAARGYPVHPVPTRHATEVLRTRPSRFPAPTPLTAQRVVAALRAGGGQGLLVC